MEGVPSESTDKRFHWQEWLPILGILVVALFLRFHSVISDPELARYGAGGFGDTQLYHRIAYHLVTGHGYSGVSDDQAYGMPGPEPVYEPAVTRGPTYPFFLALVYSAGQLPRQLSDWAPVWQRVRLVQSFLDGTICLLVFFMIRDLQPRSLKPALCGAAIYALNPYSRYYCRQLLVESVTVFLMASSLFCIVRSLHSRRSVAWCAAGGMFLALVAMSRAEYLVFSGAMTLAIAFCARQGHKIRMTAAFVLAFGLTLMPWSLRMTYTLHRFAATATGATGVALWVGSYETNSNWGGWNVYPAELDLSEEERAVLEQTTQVWDQAYQTGLQKSAEYDKYFMAMAKKRMSERPLQVLYCWLVRVPRLWYQEQIQMYPVPEPSGNLMLVFLSFALIGIWHYRGKNILPLVCLPAFLTVALLPVHIESRYSMSALPAVISLAGLGLGKALETSDRENPPV